MRKMKLKKWVIPSISMILIGVISICLGLTYKPSGDSTEKVLTPPANTVIPVFNEEINTIIKPVDDTIQIKNKYYSKDSDQEHQLNSLIIYNDTYMPSTGLTYYSDEVFSAYSVLDGIIKSITKDELLGNVVTIDHGNNIVTIYYSLADLKVKENDQIKQGETIGLSTTNSLLNCNSIIFEVSIDGKIIDPETFYMMDINSIN